MRAEGQGLREGGDYGGDIRIMLKKNKDLKVRDILVLRRKDGVPADAVILKTIPNGANQAEEAGVVIPLRGPLTQPLQSSSLALLNVAASAPSKDVRPLFVLAISISGDRVFFDDIVG
ncbi:hypothetical protein B9Z19DRAFT_1120013 [Tuber borchii]|uniref:Uncharacterized protein n=1 Tax=Tuber borchii TaxID=42251 RepID=A0A2T7A586_TUBBO|nr:hypothetical protein B9Z19DRAFT_1120013 [Tuber borchii]